MIVIEPAAGGIGGRIEVGLTVEVLGKMLWELKDKRSCAGLGDGCFVLYARRLDHDGEWA